MCICVDVSMCARRYACMHDVSMYELCGCRGGGLEDSFLEVEALGPKVRLLELGQGNDSLL